MDEEEQLRRIALALLNMVEITRDSALGQDDDQTTATIFEAEGSLLADLGAIHVSGDAPDVVTVDGSNLANGAIALVGYVLRAADRRGIDGNELLAATREMLETS